MPTRSSTKRQDVNQLAAEIVQAATASEEVSDTVATTSTYILPTEIPSDKNPAAVALGRLGGRKGGAARAKRLSKEQRVEIARKAALSRWTKHHG